MDCSVVICTRNRAAQLAVALASIAKLHIPAGTNWEVVVVDNGSTDTTPDVIRSFEGKLPIRRVSQPAAGISNARNAGVDAAQGKYLLWTDDDVDVDPNWLAAYLEAFKRWPEAALFGGKITPVLQPPTPDWFRNAMSDLGLLLAMRDFGPAPRSLSIAGDWLPFGANWAVRAAEQKQNRYDTELGAAPGRRRYGEETAVIRAILDKKNTGWWVPNAEVKHLIPASRQTIKYLFNYYEGMGEASAYSLTRYASSPLSSILFETGVKLPLAFVRYYLAHKLHLKSWVRYLTSYAYHHGKFRYWLATLVGETEGL